MKSRLFLLPVGLVMTGMVAAQDISVMSFNIRLNTASDSLNAWPYRKEKLSSQVLYHAPQVLGVQEALPDQMNDLRASLKQYRSIGGGRDNGTDKGEASAIFYDTTQLAALQSGMLWLSETPTVAGSKGWDAAFPRVITWVKFRHKKSGKQFVAFNTHFDHMGKVARRESAHMVLKTVKEIAGKLPAFFTGDFNATPDDEPIQVIMDKNNPLHLTDAKTVTVKPHYGPTGTFNAFKNKEINDQPIDYIFIKGNWKVKNHATISQTWEGRFASDHFAVLALLHLP
ncbi:endonuclease/exonuclease/phosphatase family protein [Terrimonas rubra]|uniref:Endonuclease/exonuclease/phosphatase family protein n=1 Tax=Terrimonas rubra TaxID=1035890 RepID=A0ABW6A1Y8_9BACT